MLQWRPRVTRVATDAPIAIAHRGAPRVARENTLESFAAAAALGADWAELDVHVTLDGELVVNHDPDLNRLWGHPGSIARMTLAEVRAASDGLVPLLDDVLREAAASSLRLVIDVSSSQIAEVAARHVAEAGAPALAPAFTGDPAGLVRIRSVLPEAVLLFSWELQELPASGSAGAEALAAAAPQYFNQDCLLLTAQ
jgi:hypothetical protein